MTDLPPRPADDQPPDATAALPLSIRRHAALFAVVVLGCVLVGYLRGIKEPPPLPVPAPAEPAVATPGGVPHAVNYAEVPKAPIKANDRWQNTLATLTFDKPAPSDPVVRTEEMRNTALADRAKNRAYDTAPPTIPHPTEGMTAASCIACHGTGIKVGDKVATKVSHPHLTNCTQCHVEGSNSVLAQFDTPPAENDFTGAYRSGPGGRAGPGAPPTIPHTTWMRHDCTSCHGLVARPGLRTTHPWLTNCTQCHAPSAALDQVQFPAPANGGTP
ncbi:MAG TPA: nitrate reductase cytochrome c-type subunit [Fimbriiglobus sp.]|nr:nitrate reductase cytochrome c-type subunit [Fimbriiglobus sp.]